MQNPELEKTIIWMLMMDESLMLEYSLDESDFSIPIYKVLYTTIKKYGSNLEILLGKLNEDEKNWLMECAGAVMTTSRYVENHVELKRLSQMRRRNEIAKQIQYAIAWDQPLEKIQEKISLFDSLETFTVSTEKTMMEIVEELTGTREAVYYPTLFEAFDGYLGGGYCPWQLNILAARPAVGKTMIALNMVKNHIKQGEKVAFFSLEMSTKEILQRILAMNSGMPVNSMKKQASEQQMQVINKAFSSLEKQLKNLTVIDSSSEIGDILRQIKYLHKKEGLTLVYIDYLGLIQGKGENRNNEVAKITRQLKSLALNLKITIVALHQLNRNVENRWGKEPNLSDLRDSWSVEQDADTVLMFARDTEENPKTIQCFLRKNRNGAIGNFELSCSPASMQVGNQTSPF